MKRTSVLPLALLLSFSLWTGLAAASARAQPVPTWYASRLTFADGPVLIEHFWSKGVKMRAQTVIGGRPLVTWVDETTYVIYDAMTREGIAVARSPISRAQDRGRSRPFGTEGDRIIAAGAEKVGSSVLAGRDADRYRLTDASGRREVWVTQDELRVPIQVLHRDRKTGSERRSQYLDWDAGVPLPDEFFAPPSEAKLEKLTYDEYVQRSAKGPVGPAPPFYGDLLHGRKNPDGIDVPDS